MREKGTSNKGREGGREGLAYPCTEIVTPSTPFTLARMPRMNGQDTEGGREGGREEGLTRARRS